MSDEDQAAFCTVYVTAGTASEAQHIAHVIVSERLAACANILPTIGSIYHWDGKVEAAEESAILFKTRRALFDTLADRVRALHSYDNPCVVAWPITAGSAEYLAWIGAETE